MNRLMCVLCAFLYLVLDSTAQQAEAKPSSPASSSAALQNSPAAQPARFLARAFDSCTQ